MSTRVITGEVVISYPHLHQPQPAQEGGKPKYSLAAVFLKGSQDRAKLEAAVLEAATEKFGATMTVAGKKVSVADALKMGVLRSPFRTDVAAKGYDRIGGEFFINTRSDNQPQIVYAWAGPDGKPARVPQEKIKEDIYAGARGRVSITAFGYDTAGNKGVGFALNNVQKLGEGERLDNRVKAEDEFDADLSQEPADLESLTS